MLKNLGTFINDVILFVTFLRSSPSFRDVINERYWWRHMFSDYPKSIYCDHVRIFIFLALIFSQIKIPLEFETQK